jgi:hypothetical protein
MTHTHTHTISRTLPDEVLAHRTDDTQHSKEKDILAPGGFEPAISASELPQTYALDGATTRIGWKFLYQVINSEHQKTELTSNSNTVLETVMLLCALYE